MQKKRKAQEALVESKPRLSAFAAAKARAAQLEADATAAAAAAAATAASSSSSDQQENVTQPEQSSIAHVKDLPTLLSSFPLSSAHQPLSEDDDDDNAAGYSSDDQIWTETPITKPYKSVQPRQLSSFRPTKSNVRSDTPSRLVLKIQADENVTFVGEYDLHVLAGIVVVAGAALRAGDDVRRVYAPSTHALPTIIAKGGPAEIAVISTDMSMAGLTKVSPLYGRIWNAQDLKEDAKTIVKSERRSFMLLRSSSDDPLKRSLTALELEQDVQSSLFRIMAAPRSSQPPVVLVSGPKASGKSTISRWLTNAYLTSTIGNSTPALSTSRSLVKSSFWLDLDPGQPEFSPPGQVSLFHLHAPILGPPYTHPLAYPDSSYRLIRSHTLASITPKEDSEHFLSCAMELLSHYQRLRLLFPSAPLIINCSGWVLGSAVEVLMTLIRNSPITDVILMQPMDPDVVDAIQTSLNPKGRVLLIPQRETKPVQSRTSAESRTMQTLSYFHSVTSPPRPHPAAESQGKEVSRLANCNTSPLSHHKPWRVSYSGPEAGVFAIVSYGEPPPPAHLSTVLNTSLVAICVIDNALAFPTFASSSSDVSSADAEDADSPRRRDLDSRLESLVARTGGPEDLPYLLPDSSGLVAPLNPRYSRCLGLGLVRGIDSENRELHILTPIPVSVIAAAVSSFKAEEEDAEWGLQNDDDDDDDGEGGRTVDTRTRKVVLVRGRLDGVDWAVLEDVYAGVEYGEGVEMPYLGMKRKKQSEQDTQGGGVDAVGGELGGSVWRVRHLPRKAGGGGGGG